MLQELLLAREHPDRRGRYVTVHVIACPGGQVAFRPGRRHRSQPDNPLTGTPQAAMIDLARRALGDPTDR